MRDEDSPGAPLLIRLALRAFPRRFREAYGDDMARTFADQVQARGGRADLRMVLRAAAELAVQGMRERVRPAWRPQSPGERPAGAWRENLVWPAHAARSLMRRPGFTAVAVFTLALGMGANTAFFSVVNTVLLEPLPYRDPDGLVIVWKTTEGSPTLRGGDMSLPDLLDAASLPAFESLVGQRAGTVTVLLGEEPEVIPSGRVTSGLLEVFRLSPVLGRDIRFEDNATGAPLVAVVGHDFWQNRLGGRRDVVGTAIELSGVDYTIVGVAPPGFDFPDHAQLWIPRRVPEQCGRGCHTLYTIGRLAPGATLETAAAQLETLAARLSAEFPPSNLGKHFRVVRLADDMVADVRVALWLILGAVGLLLLVACANVANLLLAQGVARRNEIAVRTALGASRWRLTAERLAESALLSFAGGAAGLLLAVGGLAFLRSMPAGMVPRMHAVHLDTRVLLFTLAVSAVVALAFGAGPAAFRADQRLTGDLVSTQRAGRTPAARRFTSLLLAVEVALSLLLLTGAGLLVRSFDRMLRVRLGFEPDRLTRFEIVLTGSRYRDLGAITRFFDALEERLAALPGVQSTGSVYGPPLTSQNISGTIYVEGEPPPQPGQELHASMHGATPGYASTAGIPLLRGRWIEPDDAAESLPVAVISQEFARRVFAGRDPIGQRIRVAADFGFGSHTWTVVGVAGDVKRGLQHDLRLDVYVPLAQYGPGQMYVFLRSRAGAPVPGEEIRSIVRELDAKLPVRNLETMDAAIAREVAPTRFYMATLATFAIIGVTLAAIGLYGVVTFLVSRRTREIGVRMALGAGRVEVIRLVLRQGMQPVAVGLLAGLGLTLAAGRLARSMLFQVSPHDPAILGAVTLLLGAVAMLAVFLPAYRAGRVDPASTLRAE